MTHRVMTSRTTNGVAIRALREAIGIRQDGLAASVGISRAFLANIEAGRKQPSVAVVRRIADNLGVDLAAITYPTLERPSARREPEEVAA